MFRRRVIMLNLSIPKRDRIKECKRWLNLRLQLINTLHMLLSNSINTLEEWDSNSNNQWATLTSSQDLPQLVNSNSSNHSLELPLIPNRCRGKINSKAWDILHQVWDNNNLTARDHQASSNTLIKDTASRINSSNMVDTDDRLNYLLIS